MGKAKSLKAAFAYFGTVKTNPVWGWAARSPDGQTVAITMWRDQTVERDGKLIYDVLNPANLHEWTRRAGNRDRIEQLKWARDHLDGRVRVLMVEAENTAAFTRKVVSREPQPSLVMQVLKLNEATGEFYAESVER